MSLEKFLQNNRMPEVSSQVGKKLQRPSVVKEDQAATAEFENAVEETSRRHHKPTLRVGTTRDQVRAKEPLRQAEDGGADRDTLARGGLPEKGEHLLADSASVAESLNAVMEGADGRIQLPPELAPHSDSNRNVAKSPSDGSHHRPQPHGPPGPMMKTGDSSPGILGGKEAALTHDMRIAGELLREVPSSSSGQLWDKNPSTAVSQRSLSAALTQAEQMTTTPLHGATAALEGAVEKVLPTFIRKASSVNSSGPANEVSLELKVLRQEKHLPVMSLPGRDGQALQVVSATESLQSAEPATKTTQRRLSVRDLVVASPLKSPNPSGEQSGATLAAKADVSPTVMGQVADNNGFAQKVTQRILSEVPRPTPPPEHGKTSSLHPNAPLGGTVVRVLEVALEPASLGTLTVRLSLRGQDLSVTLAADSQTALDAMKRDRDGLEAALKGAGYTLDELKIHRTDHELLRSQSHDQGLRGDAGNKNWSSDRGGEHAGTLGSGEGGQGGNSPNGEKTDDGEMGSAQPGPKEWSPHSRSIVV